MENLKVEDVVVNKANEKVEYTITDINGDMATCLDGNNNYHTIPLAALKLKGSDKPTIRNRSNMW